MAHWYYGENGQQVGPVDENTIRTAMHEGRVGQQTLVWREGMPAWLPLAQVQELGGYAPVPAGYPAAPAGYPAAPYTGHPGYANNYGPTSGLAITSMICGIMGFVTCIIFLGIPAVICGHMALKQISESELPRGGRGMAISGLIMGYIQVISMLVMVVAIIIGAVSQ